MPFWSLPPKGRVDSSGMSYILQQGWKCDVCDIYRHDMWAMWHIQVIGMVALKRQNIRGTTKQKLSLQKFLKKLQNITNISADTTVGAFANAKAKVLGNNRAKSFAKTKAKFFTNITAKVFANITAKVLPNITAKFLASTTTKVLGNIVVKVCQNIVAKVC